MGYEVARPAGMAPRSSTASTRALAAARAWRRQCRCSDSCSKFMANCAVSFARSVISSSFAALTYFLGKLAYGDGIVHRLVRVAQGPMKHDGKLLRGGYGPIFGVNVAVALRVDRCRALDHFAELATRVLVFDSPIKVLKQTYLRCGSQTGNEGRAHFLVLLAEVHERAA
jgi:hypothetical protein